VRRGRAENTQVEQNCVLLERLGTARKYWVVLWDGGPPRSSTHRGANVAPVGLLERTLE
jgi:hypothetical protein